MILFILNYQIIPIFSDLTFWSSIIRYTYKIGISAYAYLRYKKFNLEENGKI